MLSNREDAVNQTYANMGEKQNEWGNCPILRYVDKNNVEHWENVSMYTDQKLIGKHIVSNLLKHLEIDRVKTKILRFADFGGAEGFLAQSIQNQFRDLGFPSFGVSIDKKAPGENKQESLQSFKTEDLANLEQIFNIRADFTTDLDIEPNSLDFGIIRNAIQYCGKDKIELLGSISKYIKKGGLIIAQNPICTIENQDNINHFVAVLSSILVGDNPKNWIKKHYFPTISELITYGEKLGLETLVSYEATDMPIPISVENNTNGSRFKTPTNEQKAQIKDLFQKHFNSDHYFHIPGVVVFRKG
jgi:hypothetical protein